MADIEGFGSVAVKGLTKAQEIEGLRKAVARNITCKFKESAIKNFDSKAISKIMNGSGGISEKELQGIAKMFILLDLKVKVSRAAEGLGKMDTVGLTRALNRITEEVYIEPEKNREKNRETIRNELFPPKTKTEILSERKR